MSVLLSSLNWPWSLQTLLVGVVVIITTVLWKRSATTGLPPGPRGLPLVGNLFSMTKEPYTRVNIHHDLFLHHQDIPVVFQKWSKKYGDVFTVYAFRQPRVVLNGFSAIREALVTNADVFSSRPYVPILGSPDQSAKGLLFEPYTARFKEHKKFTMSALRDFGVGKRSMEGKILEEAQALSDFILKKEKQAFCISRLLKNTTCNVISSIVFGSRYEYDDVKGQELLLMIEQTFSINRIHMLPIMFPKARVIPSLREGSERFLNNQIKLREHFREEVAKHKETFDRNDIRDFIDAFLLEADKREGDEDSTFTEEQLVEILRQLFLAGTDTTANTLHWAVLFMILHPDIQQKVQQEIDSVLGPNQDPSMEHRSQMPYTEATLSEINRMAATVPMASRHFTTGDIDFRGYHIPKATAVEVNIWSVLRDPQLWPEPNKFDPTRFLDDTGMFTKREEMIVFSMGRRLCPGERLAKVELFLIFTSLLQRFTFKPPEGSAVRSAEGVFGLVYAPAPFQLVAEPRK
ncbi:cytochrome P450 2U1-like [Branchiostoma floridae]|uniref:Cytochrome P450 2U1 n=1 Tax=Branchiostoma floridae TaxID=7739 RepID=A0A9J7NDU6_BRAFL|nr:cytochrome P450 2U1-like [Branchiostoma floridae]